MTPNRMATAFANRLAPPSVRSERHLAQAMLPDGVSEDEYLSDDLSEGQGLADEARADQGAMQFVRETAKELGLAPDTPIERMLGAIWEASPTDAVGEAIERVAGHLGVDPPWRPRRQSDQSNSGGGYSPLYGEAMPDYGAALPEPSPNPMLRDYRR